MFLEPIKALSLDGRSISIHNLSGFNLDFHIQVGITDIRLIITDKPANVEAKRKRGRPRKNLK